MSHKKKDSLRLEEYCRIAGLSKEYLRHIADAAIRNYQRKWLPVMVIRWTPDSVPVMKKAISILADIRNEYPRDRIEEAVTCLSRLDMLDVLLEEAVKYVREEYLTDTEHSYDLILTEILMKRGRENVIEAMDVAGVSRSVYFERKTDLMVAIGLALTCYSANEAAAALGEW